MPGRRQVLAICVEVRGVGGIVCACVAFCEVWWLVKFEMKKKKIIIIYIIIFIIYILFIYKFFYLELDGFGVADVDSRQILNLLPHLVSHVVPGAL